VDSRPEFGCRATRAAASATFVSVSYQSLYRRYRPQRFAELQGQEHVANALRNAVRDERVLHAYLFSGPRGTGKTSSARILAKALNCTNLQSGEPCCECESCIQVVNGSSMDVIELDAASNNGVDAMRELVSRAALGTSGRRKVYIVDEVHMLSTAAANALLKTLEEPPDHVVFVLATTDPQKVLPTIISRTQHFEFRLAALDTLTHHLQSVAADAGIELDDATITQVARKGNGSFREHSDISIRQRETLRPYSVRWATEMRRAYCSPSAKSLTKAETLAKLCVISLVCFVSASSR
jgi:DNA polymerase III subunit gamma/tau